MMTKTRILPSGVLESESESESHSVMSDSLQSRELYSPWNSPGQHTGVGSLSLLEGVFPTQVSNPGPQHSTVHPVNQRWYESWNSFVIPILCIPVQSLQLGLTLCYPMDSNPPGSSVHGIVLMSRLPFPPPGGSSQPRN